MDPLSVSASIVALLKLSGSVVDYVRVAVGASKDRERLMLEIRVVRGLLITLKDMLEGPQLKDEYKGINQLLITPDGPLVLFRKALERLESRLAAATKAGTVWKALKWPFDKPEVSDLLSTLERLKSLFTLAIGNDHFGLSLKINKGIEGLHGQFLQLSNGMTQLQIAQESQQRHQEHQAILDWLSPLDFGAKQIDYYSMAQQGTGQWLLDADAFNQWLNLTTRVLWCPGHPGAGKTIIASIVINHIQQNVVRDDVRLVYVYCGYKEPNQSVLNLIGSLLKQLAQCHEVLSDETVKIYKKHKESRSHLSLDQCVELLQNEIGLHRKVFVVVDALDELSSKDRDGFMTEILRLPSNAGVFATSRDHFATIDDAFKEITTLEISATSDDVRRYVEKRIKATPQLASLLNDRLQDDISDAIVDKAKGMFLIAGLYMNALEIQDNVRAVREAIQSFPEELDAIYEGAMERIQSQDRQKKKRGLQVLSWIRHAIRPLTVPEILQALAVNPKDEDLDREALTSVDILVSACAGLVTVDQESNIIRLAHETTQHFFESTQADYFPDTPIEIAKTCLTYLSFNRFAAGACPSNQLSQRFVHYPFLLYAANYWAKHVRDIEDELLEQLLLTFLKLEGNLSCAVQAAIIPEHPFLELGEHLPKTVPVLWLTAHYDLKKALLHLLAERNDIEARNSVGETALYRASLDGHEHIVRLLLDHGADVNARGGHRGTALHAAINGSHMSTMVTLLEHGADLEWQGSEDAGTALQYALDRGHQDMAAFLLERGADPNAGLASYGNALAIAISRSQIKMVKMLLDHGADVNGKVHWFFAANQGSPDIIRLLLDRGADAEDKIESVVFKGNIGLLEILIERVVHSDKRRDILNRGLMEAALQGQYESFMMLLDHGADIHTRGGKYGTVLQAAAASAVSFHQNPSLISIKTIVTTLLEKGASIETEGGYYGNALQAAASQGYDDIVALFLQWEADVNARGGYFGTALQAAASGAGYLGIQGDSIQFAHAIQMELEKGANVEEVVKSLLVKLAREKAEPGYLEVRAKFTKSVDGMGAKLADYKKVISMLNEKGVDVNAYGGYIRFDDRPSRYEKIIHMLLQKGADINALGGRFGSALQAALCQEHGSPRLMPKGGNTKIARLLLDRGADANAKGGLFGTPLQAAAAEGNAEMVQALLQAGADVNFQGGCCNNALQAAAGGSGSTEQQEEIVAILLERGAVLKCSDWSSNAIASAARRGFDKVVMMLLDSCTEVDGELLVGALTLAAENGHDRVVQLLLERRTGVALQDGYLEIALQAASGHPNDIHPNDIHPNGIHPNDIDYVRETTYINILDMLISEGAKINQPGGFYGNALQAAAAEGSLELVDILLEYGADINAQGGFHGNVLQALALRKAGTFQQRTKAVHLIMTLLDRGVDVNAEGGEYGTALQAAVRRGSEAIVITLLERGAKVNHQGGKFGTALHAAVFKNYLYMMQVLLRYGVDVGTPDQYGFTVAYWVQNDTKLTSNRRREVRNLVNKVMKGSATDMVNVVIRRENIVSLLEQLKQVGQGEALPFYYLGKALLYDGRCEAAAYCFQKQYSVLIRKRRSYGIAGPYLRYSCRTCRESRETDKYHICKVCRDFVVCSKCFEAPSDKMCKTHDFLEFKPDKAEETKTAAEEDRSLCNWIDQMLKEYRT